MHIVTVERRGKGSFTEGMPSQNCLFPSLFLPLVCVALKARI